MALSLCSLPKNIEMAISRQTKKSAVPAPPPVSGDPLACAGPQADDPQARVRQRTVALLQALAPDEGYNLTALPDVACCARTAR